MKDSHLSNTGVCVDKCYYVSNFKYKASMITNIKYVNQLIRRMSNDNSEAIAHSLTCCGDRSYLPPNCTRCLLYYLKENYTVENLFFTLEPFWSCVY